jgi:hypothetical protein
MELHALKREIQYAATPPASGEKVELKLGSISILLAEALACATVGLQ